MTTIPARSLSGDHLGRRIDFATGSGHLHEVGHRGSYVSITIGQNGRYALRHLHPSVEITIEDTE